MITLFSCNGDTIKSEEQDAAVESKYEQMRDLNPDSLTYSQLYDRTLVLWDLPIEEKDCDTQFGKGHVIIAGPKDAPPLVLLHGMNASSTSWYPNISALAEAHRVYAIDFIMEVNKSKMTKELRGDDVIEFYDEMFACLGLEKFDILGASRGGWLATQIAVNSPDRIEKLVLLSPAQTFIWIPPSKKLLTNFLYTLSPSRDDLRDALEALSNDVNKIDQLYIDQYYRATTQSEIDGAVMDMTPLGGLEFLKLKMPVLVIVGDNDFANTKRSLKIAEAGLPNVKTIYMKDAGHFVSIDQADKVNKEVLDFLDE